MSEKPPKLRRDWIGRYVRLIRQIENGVRRFPKGEIFRVRGAYDGFYLETVRPCSACGNSRLESISRVPERDLEILPVDYDPETKVFEVREISSST